MIIQFIFIIRHWSICESFLKFRFLGLCTTDRKDTWFRAGEFTFQIYTSIMRPNLMLGNIVQNFLYMDLSDKKENLVYGFIAAEPVLSILASPLNFISLYILTSNFNLCYFHFMSSRHRKLTLSLRTHKFSTFHL